MSAEDLKKIRLKVQIGVTTIIGLFCMSIIIFKPADSELVKWAIGIIGIIIGYWLK